MWQMFYFRNGRIKIILDLLGTYLIKLLDISIIICNLVAIRLISTNLCDSKFIIFYRILSIIFITMENQMENTWSCFTDDTVVFFTINIFMYCFQK